MVSVKKEPPDLVILCDSSDSDNECGDQGQSTSATSADVADDSDSEIVIRRKRGRKKNECQSK